MKKAIFIALVLACLSNLVNAQTDTAGRQAYYYYPGQNVYFNQKNNTYLYYDSVSANWKTVNLLPPMYNINKQTLKDIVYYNGPDVWMDNAAHIKQYGLNPPSKAKQK